MNTQETPVEETPAENVETTESQDREFDVEARGETLTLVETTHKKGKSAGKLAYFIKVDLTAEDPFGSIRKIVGEENWNRAVMATLVRPNCNDATRDAMSPEGTVSDTSWINAFSEQFLPGSRRSGTGIKQLREKIQAIMEEVQPYMLRLAKKETLSDEDNNRYLNLVVEYADIQEKIEGAARHGKKTKAAK